MPRCLQESRIQLSMKRLYFTALLFVVPALLVIALLGQFFPFGSESVSQLFADFAPWLVFIFIAAACIDWLLEMQAKNMVAALLPCFDQGPSSPPTSSVTPQWIRQSELRTQAIGTYHGRLLQIVLHNSITKNVPSYLSINLACQVSWQFQIRRHGIVLYVLERFREDHIKTGAPELDSHCVFISDTPESLIDWASRKETQQRILSLISKYAVSSIGTPEMNRSSDIGASDMTGSSIDARYYRYPSWNSGRIIQNIPGVLADLEALAISLEQFASSRIAQDTAS